MRRPRTHSTMLRMLRAVPAILLGCVVLTGAAFAQDDAQAVTALIGATIHPVSGPAIDDGIVVIQNGRIVAVGADIEPPAGAEVIDLAGLHLYPGFVHPGSVLGLTEINSVAGTVDVREMGENNADLRSEVAFHADSLLLPEAMAGGVLSAHVVTDGSLFTGTSAVLRLDGWNWQDMTVADRVGLHLQFPREAGGDGEGDEGGEGGEGDGGSQGTKEIDDLLQRAKHYAKAKAAGTVVTDPKLEPFLPLLDGTMPLYLHADEKGQIEKALDWAAEQGFEKLVLVTGADARYVADRLAKDDVQVILRGTLVLPRRKWEAYDTPFTTPKVLHDAGVRFAIGDQGDADAAAMARNLPFHAARAAAYGLPHDAALRSVTLAPAEILGVADHLGSIEEGKEATFFAATGDPLEILTTIERVWVAGREIDLESRHQYRLYQRYDNRPRPATAD